MQASVIARGQQLPSRELNQGGTGTAALVFLDSTTATAPIVAKLNMGALSVSTGKLCSAFKVTMGGRVTGGTTTSFTPTLYWGTSATTASNTAICTGAAVAVNSVSGTWYLEATLQIDQVSGKITGHFKNQVSGSTVTYTAEAVITNVITSSSTPALSFTTNTAQGFVAAGTFSSGNAANVAYLDVFQIAMIG